MTDKNPPATPAPAGRRSSSHLREVLLVVGIVLLAANMRSALASVAPLSARSVWTPVYPTG